MKRNISSFGNKNNNTAIVQISLGRDELNALMFGLDQNKTVLDGILEDSALNLQQKILNTNRYKPEKKEKNQGELVSLQFVGEEITQLIQHFVGMSLSQSKDVENVTDFFEGIKEEKIGKKEPKNQGGK